MSWRVSEFGGRGDEIMDFLVPGLYKLWACLPQFRIGILPGVKGEEGFRETL
jgi:hypothetical protein